MKTIIFLSVYTLLVLGGLLYWMYKSRQGELVLSQKSWHLILLRYMWDDNLKPSNGCPYYWSLVVSITILIPYLLFRYCLVLPINWTGNHWPKWAHISLPSWQWGYKLPKVTVPTSAKEVYWVIYRKGKTIMAWLLAIIVAIIVFIIAVYVVLYPFMHWHAWMAILVDGIIAFVLVTTIIGVAKPDWNHYHIDHYENFGKGIKGIVCMPFVVSWAIICWIFSAISGVYADNCPPIKWID